MLSLAKNKKTEYRIGAFKDEYLLDYINAEEPDVRDGQDVNEKAAGLSEHS